MTKKKSRHKDIARIDQPSKCTFGWYVRVRFHGKSHYKFFSDKKMGNREAGLLAAIKWRNDTELEIGKPRTDRHTVTVSHTNTGVIGVRLNEKLGRYEVSWVKTDGNQGKTSVSIRKHGNKGAFKRAFEIRAKKEAERLATT